METIGDNKLYSFLDRTPNCQKVSNADVRGGRGHRVSSYLDLATKIAELQFLNRDYVLFFRGQSKDYRDPERMTSLPPSLFRPELENTPNRPTLVGRFDTLRRAEQLLVEEYRNSDLLGGDRLERHRILRWSILQHYEVCFTPLLDVTHSIRIAASFASLSRAEMAYLYVLGVPNLSGAITASAEAGLQIVRLSSVCPPSALRPHIQEGYLLGEYPEIASYDQKENYFLHEMDFGLRLVAKFCFNPRSFWSNVDFPKVKHSALYPSERKDPLYKLAMNVKKYLGNL